MKKLFSNYLLNINFSMVLWMIDRYGDEDQKQKWLPSLASMKHFASYCLTEPSKLCNINFISFRTILVFQFLFSLIDLLVFESFWNTVDWKTWYILKLCWLRLVYNKQKSLYILGKINTFLWFMPKQVDIVWWNLTCA